VQRLQDQAEGEKYIKWVNEFSDSYNNERYTHIDVGGRKTKPQGMFPKVVDSSRNILAQHEEMNRSNEVNNLNANTIEVENPVKDHNSSIDLRKKSGLEQSSFSKNLDLSSPARLREKYKHKYVEQLNQQLAEKKARKALEKQMDPREKIINQKYMQELIDNRKTGHNPILRSNGMLNFEMGRVVSFHTLI
jgi:hypothetical protein